MVELVEGGLLEMAAQIRPWLDKIDRVKQVLDKGTFKIEFNLPIIVVIGD